MIFNNIPNNPYTKNPTRKHTGLALAHAELCLQILGQKHNKPRHNHQLHARTQARCYVHRIRDQTPHRPRNIFDILAVTRIRCRRICLGLLFVRLLLLVLGQMQLGRGLRRWRRIGCRLRRLGALQTARVVRGHWFRLELDATQFLLLVGQHFREREEGNGHDDEQDATHEKATPPHADPTAIAGIWSK